MKLIYPENFRLPNLIFIDIHFGVNNKYREVLETLEYIGEIHITYGEDDNTNTIFVYKFNFKKIFRGRLWSKVKEYNLRG